LQRGGQFEAGARRCARPGSGTLRPGDQLEDADSWLVRAALELAEIGIGQAGELGQLAELEV
jgi:hypothetical protein